MSKSQVWLREESGIRCSVFSIQLVETTGSQVAGVGAVKSCSCALGAVPRILWHLPSTLVGEGWVGGRHPGPRFRAARAQAGFRYRPPLSLVLGVLSARAIIAVAALGCSPWSDEPAVPTYMPAWGEARSALESALSAWRDATPPLPDSFDSPSVKFVDRHRRPNQRLLAYEILGQTDIENARQFTVRLTLDGEEAPQLVRYNALGRAPVWVFRLEDYELISHWEHKMDEPEAAQGGR
jgi:hypothetical protein